MKQIVYIGLLVTCLASCTHYQMPTFSTAGEWRVKDNALINEKAKLLMDLSDGGDLINASNGNEDLHFIASQSDFDRYDPSCVKMVKEVLQCIPLQIDSVEAILADQFIVLTYNPMSQWRPDYYRKQDGSGYVEQAWPVTSLVQPHDQIWRNLIINKKHQIITVDRFIKQGRHLAIVSIYQSERKKAPWTNILVDVTDSRNIQFTGSYLEKQFYKLAEAWTSDYELSYNDGISLRLSKQCSKANYLSRTSP